MSAMADRITLSSMRFEGHHGVSEEERALPQPLEVDLEVEADLSRAGHTDDVADTVDYEQAANAIRALAASQHFRLVETLADRIATLLVKDFGAPWVKVSAAKIGILPNAKFVGVTIERRRPG